jgi:hypothetical protein
MLCEVLKLGPSLRWAASYLLFHPLDRLPCACHGPDRTGPDLTSEESTGRTYALKRMRKSAVVQCPEHVYCEQTITKNVAHPFCIRQYASFQVRPNGWAGSQAGNQAHLSASCCCWHLLGCRQCVGRLCLHSTSELHSMGRLGIRNLILS